MSKFTNSYMTNAGKKLMFGGGQVTYTRAALFTQDVSAMSVDAIRKLDALDGQILSANVGIASQRPQDNGNSTIKVEATFSNAGQKQDAKFASVGWFAKTASTSETLIAVCEVEGGILGAGDPSGASTASINVSVNITIGDSTTVTALVDPSGTVTKTVLDSELAKKDDTTDVDAKIANLKGTVDTKADKATVDAEIGKIDFTPYAKTADVYTKSQVDSKTSGTIITAYDIASKSPTKETNSYTNKWLVDQQALGQFADQINQLKGRQEVDAPDFDTLTNTGVYFISNLDKGKNVPPTGCWGTLAVFNGNGSRITQLYVGDDGASAFVRTYGWSHNGRPTWYSWNQIAWKSDITNLQNAISNGLAGKADKSQVNVDGPLYKRLTQFNNWSDLFDGYSVHGFAATNASRLVAFRDDTNGGNTVGDNGVGVAFGGCDTKGVLSVDYRNHQARIAGGNGTNPVWHEDIAWKSDISNLQNIINQQNQTIQSLITRLTNAENEINYIKENYVEGRRFPASQEAQAEAWENENPQRIAFIER